MTNARQEPALYASDKGADRHSQDKAPDAELVNPDSSAAERTAPQPRRTPSLYSGSSIVPKQGVAGQALMTVIAIMAFLACLTLGGVFMVRDAATGWQNDISREVTVQIRPFDNIDMAASIHQAQKILRSFPGIENVRLIDDVESARLLEPYLGAGVQVDELPIPALLTLTLSPDARANLETIANELADNVPGASLDDHRSWVDRLNTMASTTVTIGAIIFLLMMAATILSVVFATRGAMAANREVIEVLHFVGAKRGFIAKEFEIHFLRLGILGALAGGVASILVFLGFGFWSATNRATAEGDQITALFGNFSVGAWELLGIILVSVVIAVLVGLTTRFTVMRHVSNLESYGSQQL